MYIRQRKETYMSKRALTPHLIVRDADAAIAYYKKAFGAVELMRLEMPGSDKIMHAELQIGEFQIMLMDEMEGGPCVTQSPLKLGGTPLSLYLPVENVDEAFKKVVDAGAEVILPVTDMFWGDRYGVLRDPFGHEWALATHIRDVSLEEMRVAVKDCMAQPVS